VPKIEFDRYYSYEELTNLLKAYAEEYPQLIDLKSIGKSYEGRDIWILEVTDKSTGEASDKPAFWCDATIHATELSPGTAVLYLLNKLCTSKDKQVLQALSTRTFYLVPRVSPDGAEWALEVPQRAVRSGTRPWPYPDEDVEGLEPADVDGDGRILSMRVPDPNGAWKVCEKEPRLLVRREPTDIEGQFYRVLVEGYLHNYDGMTLRARRRTEGLDFNRNFPSEWRVEQEQYGAGPYPTSEPEIRALVQAITDRPNICGAVTFHTFSGVLLRPSAKYSDQDMEPEDLWVYQTQGQKGTELTGYPHISNFHEFRYHPKEFISGVFDDWMFEHKGVYAWTTEIWSPQRQAGITDYKYIDWFREHPVEHDIMLLKWSDEKLGGLGHIDWKEFDHPQLGKVEIGGWDSTYAFRNPPPQFLEAEVAPHSDWVIWLALTTPKLTLRETRIEDVGGASRVRIAVQNSGYLPTNVSKIAEKKRLVRGVRATLTRLDSEEDTGAGKSAPSWLKAGKLVDEKGQLTGWSHISAGGFGGQTNGTSDVAVFEWVLAPGEYEVVLAHERAGTVRTQFSIQ
jgi:murein tripeptide amidase MpaA